MSTADKWKLFDRLTNDEFIQILPHLELEHVLLTQVLISTSKWKYLCKANIKQSLITCYPCNMTIEFPDVKSHLLQSGHITALRSNVKQVYHPFYTYGKCDIELVRGQVVTENERKKALIDLGTQMKSFKKDCLKAQHIVKCIQQQERQKEDEYLIQLALQASTVTPDEMFVKATFPFEDIPKLQFSIAGGEWKPAIAYSKLEKHGNFYCSLCSINCSGLATLNTHFLGQFHRLNQLQILGLRHEASSDVNKNCVIRFANLFSLSIDEKAKNFFKDKINTPNSTGFDQMCLTSEQYQKLTDLYKLVPNDMKSEDKIYSLVTNVDKQQSNNKDILGHIGVEYVLKIKNSWKGKDPMYECGLCEFLSDVTRMQRHLLNYDHRKKYLDIHYPATIKKFEIALGHMRFKQFRSVMSEIVHAISIEIERTYGRGLPYTVTEKDYRIRRGDLIGDVYSLPHASQIKGPSFSNVVSLKKMKKLKVQSVQLAEKRYTSMSEPVFTHTQTGIIYMKKQGVDTTSDASKEEVTTSMNFPGQRSRSISQSSLIYADVPLNRGIRDRTRSRSPIKRQALNWEHNLQYRNIWDVYRREIAIAANKIEASYVKYRHNPESHPKYEEEWNNFWQKRKRELERDGVNHRAYNFQPEWVQYFKQRIEFMFGEALHRSKTDVRRKLDIPQDAEEDCQSTNVLMSQLSKLHNSARKQRWNPISKMERQEYCDFSFSTPKHEVSDDQKSKISSKLKDDHTRVVHVLRLITALEDHLGSLGSKIMDLLSKALEMEKQFDGDIKKFEAKILTASNCKLLEMSMEKLKGILFAGLLDEKKTMGFNRIIQLTTELLNFAEKMGWRRIPVTFDTQNSISHIPNEKLLSDTLIDLVGSQRGDQNINVSKGQFYATLPMVCPPPPPIEINLLSGTYKSRAVLSGLASFDTKLSIDKLPFHQYLKHLSSRNNIDNKSFNNKNNSVRTNITQRSTGSDHI